MRTTTASITLPQSGGTRNELVTVRKADFHNDLKRVKHQACGVGNAQIRIERVWPLPDRVRALHYARTLRDVCGCLCVGENRCSRIKSLTGRHRRLRSKTRDGTIQVAVISNSRLKAKCNRFRTTKVVAARMIEILNRIDLRKRGRSGLGVGECLEEIEQPDQLKRLHNKFGRVDQFQRPALRLGRS